MSICDRFLGSRPAYSEMMRTNAEPHWGQKFTATPAKVIGKVEATGGCVEKFRVLRAGYAVWFSIERCAVSKRQSVCFLEPKYKKISKKRRGDVITLYFPFQCRVSRNNTIPSSNSFAAAKTAAIFVYGSWTWTEIFSRTDEKIKGGEKFWLWYVIPRWKWSSRREHSSCLSIRWVPAVSFFSTLLPLFTDPRELLTLRFGVILGNAAAGRFGYAHFSVRPQSLQPMTQKMVHRVLSVPRQARNCWNILRIIWIGAKKEKGGEKSLWRVISSRLSFISKCNQNFHRNWVLCI